MEIQGPFTISINDNNDTGLREIHLGFKPGFQQQDLAARVDTLKTHLAELQDAIDGEANEASRQGMTTIFQIASQLLPHLQADEIPLEETIIIEVGPTQSSPLDDLLRGATLK